VVVENENKATYEKESIAAFEVQDTAERTTAWVGREPGVVQVTLPWHTEFLGN